MIKKIFIALFVHAELIFYGWKNLAFKNEKTEIIAKERSVHCKKCDEKFWNVCTKCWCYIPAKVRSRNSECPSKLWLKDV